MSLRQMAPAVLLLLPLAACGGGDAEEAAEPAASEATAPPAPTAPAQPPADVITDLREITFAADLEVNLDEMEERDSGLFVQVLQSGSGPPAGFGDEMGVHYTVWFPNGSRLDSSEGNDPLPMVLGTTVLIDGWIEGVTGMRLGERRKLVLPHDLAYGATGRSGVPPYTPLVFEVELAEHIPTGEG